MKAAIKWPIAYARCVVMGLDNNKYDEHVRKSFSSVLQLTLQMLSGAKLLFCPDEMSCDTQAKPSSITSIVTGSAGRSFEITRFKDLRTDGLINNPRVANQDQQSWVRATERRHVGRT